MCFHQHLGFGSISGLFLFNIVGDPRMDQDRPFVFSNILGYPFIFDDPFRGIGRLQVQILTRFFQSLDFLRDWRNSHDSLLTPLFPLTLWVISQITPPLTL